MTPFRIQAGAASSVSRALRAAVAAGIVGLALGCTAGVEAPRAAATTAATTAAVAAPAGAPAAAPAPGSAAPPATAAASAPGAPSPSAPASAATAGIGVIEPAPDGAPSFPPDAWDVKDPGELLATVRLDLVPGLEAVDIQPKTIPSGLAPTPPARHPAMDTTALPPGDWLLGELPVTRDESVALAVSADRQWLALDSNRDEKLVPAERVARKEAWGGFAWFEARAHVRTRDGASVVQMLMPFRIGAALAAPRVVSRPDASRQGVVEIGGKRVRIAVLDQTFRCWFSHPRLDALVVDVDGDGAFDTTPDSFERYRLGEPFPLGDADAVVTKVGPFASTLTLHRSKTPAQRKASLRMGSAAPAFKAKTVDGKSVDLAALRGKWVLLDFWATWCGPCRGERPNLKALRQKHPDVVIVGISGDDTAEAVTSYVAREGLDWPQVHADARPIMRQYRVTSFPTSFLVAPDGTLAARDLRGPGLVSQIGDLKARAAGRGKPG